MADDESDKYRETINFNSKKYTYYSLNKASNLYGDVHNLPFSIKIVLENLLRNSDNQSVKEEQIISIGVLFFNNLSSEDDEYLCYNFTKDLIY